MLNSIPRGSTLVLFFLIVDVNPIKIPANITSTDRIKTSDAREIRSRFGNDIGGSFTEVYPVHNGYNEAYADNETDYYNESFPTQEEILEYIYPKSWTWALIFFHCVVFLIGLVGNCLVCAAVYRNHTMRTVTNYFIVNLAAADFLVILFCLPPSVVWDVTSTWWFGSDMCKIVLYLQSVSVTVSVLTLTFISVDRWYAICFPLKFKSTTGRAKTAIAIIWIIALVCEIPEPIYLTAVPFNESFIYFTQCKPSWSDETDTIFMIVKMLFFYLIPLLFMSMAYLQIIRVLWKSGNVSHQAVDATGRGGAQLNNTFAMNMNTTTESQLRSRRKAAKMLVAVVAMFAFCFLPVHLLSILRLTVKLTNSEWNQAFSLISHWLCYANSAINPIIYNFMSGKFRKEFRRAFDSCCQRGDPRERYHNCGGTFYHKDTGYGSRTHSRHEEIHRLNTYRDFDPKLTRKVCSSEDFPSAKTPLGEIRGFWRSSYEGKKFAAFEGFPYTKPTD